MAEPAYVVGKFYRVPCVLTSKGQVIGYGSWVPIIGPKHDDAEHIKFPWPHWHVDWRFVSNVMLARAQQRSINGSEFSWPVQEWCSSRITKLVLAGPELRLMKCKRQFAPYPRRDATWMAKLEAAHAGCHMKNMVCPHRGIPLAGAQADGDVVTCPGHGLRWNVKTGELVT